MNQRVDEWVVEKGLSKMITNNIKSGNNILG